MFIRGSVILCLVMVFAVMVIRKLCVFLLVMMMVAVRGVWLEDIIW
jgi:hypothetical protein